MLPAHYRLAKSEIGTKEIRGKRDNQDIVKYFKDVGHSEIDNDETAWCAAAMGSWLERSGIKSTGSLLARSYSKWADRVASIHLAKPGDVVVIWRVSPKSWQGHVGIYVRHDSKTVTLISGNHRDAVTQAEFPRHKIVAIRRAPGLDAQIETEMPPIVGAKFTAVMLRKIAPRGRKDLIDDLAPLLNKYLAEYEVNTPRRMTMFLANIMAETGGLKIMEENLNYSAKRMTQVWPTRFRTVASALPYANNPEKLANKVYNRFGNKGIPGAGYKYRGRGFMQTTFIDNYRAVERATGLAVVDHPDMLLQAEPALRAALVYWKQRGLNALADKATNEAGMKAVRKRVNGGLHGYDRMVSYARIILPLVTNIDIKGETRKTTTIGVGGGATTGVTVGTQYGMQWGWYVFGAVVATTIAMIAYRQYRKKKDAKKFMAQIARLENLHSQHDLDLRSNGFVDRTGFDQSIDAH